MNGVIIFHPAYKEKWCGHYCFFGHRSNCITHFWEVVKKLKGLNLWPFTGITSTIAYSIESSQVVAPTVSFLLWDANDVLIARFNPICLGQLLKNWVCAILFVGQYQLSWHQREIMIGNLKGVGWEWQYLECRSCQKYGLVLKQMGFALWIKVR